MTITSVAYSIPTTLEAGEHPGGPSSSSGARPAVHMDTIGASGAVLYTEHQVSPRLFAASRHSDSRRGLPRPRPPPARGAAGVVWPVGRRRGRRGALRRRRRRGQRQPGQESDVIRDGRPLLRIRRVQGAAQLGRKGLRAGEVHVLVLARDVAANREPAGEPAVADRARDPHALVETPDVGPQVVLVAV